MRYLSVCSGIEAASVAWHPLGFLPVGFAEIDPFACSVLAHRFPGVTNFGDLTGYRDWSLERDPDIIVGGTPCQSFSVAGLRKGMADPRGNLALTFLGLVDRVKPTWVVWENVPGVLSSNGGRDFGAILGALAQLGYGFAYRVLDAQYFGVPQRRRRVFVVGHRGDWRRAAAVLFDSQSMRGNPTPSRKAGEETSGTLASRTSAGGGLGTDFDLSGGLVSASVTSMWAKGSGGPAGDECQNLVAHTLRGEKYNAGEDGTGRGTPLVPVAFSCKDHGADVGDISPTLRAMPHDGSHSNGGGQVAVADTIGVRRLMPVECERLQGFPDNWTLVPHGPRAKPAADGPRYKAIGNSMAVPVMAWIGQRIKFVEGIACSPAT